MRTVRIESDGSTYGTRVVDMETGKPLRDITSLRIEQKAGNPPIAYLEETVLVGAMVVETKAEIESQSVSVQRIGD